MKTIALTNFELASVLQGRPMVCCLDDGTAVRVRLTTADELLASNAASIANLFPDGGGPEPMTREEAWRLTRAAS